VESARCYVAAARDDVEREERAAEVGAALGLDGLGGAELADVAAEESRVRSILVDERLAAEQVALAEQRAAVEAEHTAVMYERLEVAARGAQQAAAVATASAGLAAAGSNLSAAGANGAGADPVVGSADRLAA